jgi:hypothetical protein
MKSKARKISTRFVASRKTKKRNTIIHSQVTYHMGLLSQKLSICIMSKEEVLAIFNRFGSSLSPAEVRTNLRPSPIGVPSIFTCSAYPARGYLNGGRLGGAAWFIEWQKQGEHGWNIFGREGLVPAKCLARIKTLWQEFGTRALCFFLWLPPASSSWILSFRRDARVGSVLFCSVLFCLTNHFPGAGG